MVLLSITYWQFASMLFLCYNSTSKSIKEREKMTHTIINTAITFVVSSILGYCVSLIKNYKKKLTEKVENEKIQNTALQALLKSQLTNIYFVYSELKQIPDYAYQNFLDMLKVYEGLGGDGFIHTIAQKMESWEIVKTDIL